MKFLINSLIVAIVLIFTACGGSGSSGGKPTVSSVKIAPTSVMFTSPNQSMVLSAKAYDASGKELNVDINWSSSHTNIISIASDGNATAQGIIGSSLITAEVDGVKSAPVIVLVTKLVDGAILVDDDQVIGKIELLDPAVPPGVGSQYKVTLKGLALPKIGDILVGTGELPIAGQVVSAELINGVVHVTLEILPIDQMFTELVINEVWDLGKITPYIPEEIANHYTVTEEADGTMLFTPKSSLSALSTVSKEFEFTPFTCKLEGTGTVPTFSLSNPVSAIRINRNFSLDLAYDSALGGFQKASVIGDLKAVFKAKPSLAANLNAKVSCDVELGSIPLPINPSLSWLLGFSVPLGVGFEVGGQLELAQLGADIDVNAHYIAEFGVECPLGNSCTSIHKLTDDDSTFKTDWVLPSGNIENNLRLKPEISGFGSAKLAIDIGNRYIGRIIGTSVATRFELIEAKGGLKQDADLAMIPAQVENTAYRSEYKLSIFSSIGAGSDINNWLSYVGMTGSVFEYQFPEILLASSPKALSATASQDQYNYGDAVTFTVELNQATVNYGFLGYNVDEISIYKRVPNAEGSYDYIHFFDMPATEGQTKFEREWVFTDDGNITDNYYAFVKTKFLPTFGEFGILEFKPVKAADGRLSRMDYYENGVYSHTRRLTYNQEDLMTAIYRCDNNTSMSSCSSTPIVKFTYNTNGRVIESSEYSGDVRTNITTYDDYGRTTSITRFDPDPYGIFYEHEIWEYDSATGTDNTHYYDYTSVTDYDKPYEHKSVTEGNIETVYYRGSLGEWTPEKKKITLHRTYDRHGNIISAQYELYSYDTENSGGWILDTTQTYSSTISYDSYDNVSLLRTNDGYELNIIYTYDADGNVLTSNRSIVYPFKTYHEFRTYDADGDLLSYKTDFDWFTQQDQDIEIIYHYEDKIGVIWGKWNYLNYVAYPLNSK